MPSSSIDNKESGVRSLIEICFARLFDRVVHRLRDPVEVDGMALSWLIQVSSSENGRRP